MNVPSDLQTVVGVPLRDRTWAVIGAGPVGAVLAAHLSAAVERLVVVDTNPAIGRVITEEGVRITGVRTLDARLPRFRASVRALAEDDPDVVVIATKTWAMPLLLPELEAIHRPGRIYVVAQNGMDNERMVVDRFGAETTVRMVVNFAGIPLAPGAIQMTFFHPPNYLGGAPAAAEIASEVADLLTTVGLASVFTSDLRRHLWKKVAMNAAGGAICALTRRDMQGILSCEGTRTFVRRVLREAAAVANADGFAFDEYFVQGCFEYMAGTGSHRPSMLQDVEAGRPTEVDVLNWRIVELGRKLGVAAPYNETLGVLVHGIEAHSGSCYGFRMGSLFTGKDGTAVCGLCPYDHGHTAVLGTSVTSTEG